MAKKEDKRKNREQLDDWDSLYDEFGDESDRGHALLAASALDILLRDLIAAFLVDDEKEAEELLGSENNPDKPLGTFGTRIRTAYCLGLITKDQRDNLKQIKDIRNHFAHNLHSNTFEDEVLRNWVAKLKRPGDSEWPFEESPRQQFGYAYTDLEVDLLETTEWAKVHRRKVRERSLLDVAHEQLAEKP